MWVMFFNSLMGLIVGTIDIIFSPILFE
jgi:hypothetical protein